jgi:hypothetical protein
MSDSEDIEIDPVTLCEVLSSEESRNSSDDDFIDNRDIFSDLDSSEDGGKISHKNILSSRRLRTKIIQQPTDDYLFDDDYSDDDDDSYSEEY